MKFHSLAIWLFLICGSLNSQDLPSVEVSYEEDGSVLCVGEKRFVVNGMNWDYIPIGKNAVNANLWGRPDDIIEQALDAEMALLKEMGVNTIRVYTGVPAKWIAYIYKEHGIYTMLNHPLGRYGLSIDGKWNDATDYSDEKTIEILLAEVKSLASEYRDTPGLLLYLLGNENNYGLFWDGAETEDIPNEAERQEYIGEKRARPMYKLMNEAANSIKSVDVSHPVALCNGDIIFLKIIAEECKDVDIFGVNVYRGPSFTDMFSTVKKELNKPILLTEFGADAYNTVKQNEDQKAQASYLLSNWKEIYMNTSGLGKAQNCIGGFTFQFSDGWWKYDFDNRKNEDIHDNNASWSNGGYDKDFIKGQDNMNEEWFGICAKGPTDTQGLYTLIPRAAYYMLKEVHKFDPYNEKVNPELLDDYFNSIDISKALEQSATGKTPN